ncbi:cyclic nucleotide-binding/CBS domain-containing protein [Halomicrobium salinisoli]|uniref:CBS domain-containing protein n=1 Tax=Halomicrobium salinisoli TaxID=2878391 RepID=UPI001CEFD666|nr:CBS domain-containing protein [Halomicrobium salinisoli]
MIDPEIEPAITRAARTVSPSTPVGEAAAHLRDPSVPALVVLDESDEVAGIVTESDLVALLAETDDPDAVDQCVSAPATTIRPTATVREAAERMRAAGVKRLPVVDGGAYCGLVTAATLTCRSLQSLPFASEASLRSASLLAPYCSRRTLDVERSDEPLAVDATAARSAAATE